MKRSIHFGIAAICWLIVATSAYSLESISQPSSQSSSPQIAAQGTLQAAFTPSDDIESIIVETLEGAKQQVLVQAYLFTSKKISMKLIAIHRRGVDVRVMVDADQLDKGESSKVPELVAAGIPVWLETKFQHAHNKIIVIDADTPDAVVITGSYNFTWTAQHKNAENILVARGNPTLASRYAMNWHRHKHDASPYRK